MTTIAVIDYGMGNLHSVGKALEKVSSSHSIVVTSDSDLINKADKIVLPGVGSIQDCMNALSKEGLYKTVIQNISSKPTLAICVGMQMLLKSSEENSGTEGLGIMDGVSKLFKFSDSVKVPHMGWNKVKQILDHHMWQDIPNNSYFYFVHSYACRESLHSVGVSHHGQDFISAFSKGNIFAVQFHPEKSQEVGLQLYKNFISWKGI